MEQKMSGRIPGIVGRLVRKGRKRERERERERGRERVVVLL